MSANENTQGKFYCASVYEITNKRRVTVLDPPATAGGTDIEILLLVSKFYGQATKGTRWMPWHFEAMKDVASCDKLRLGASIL
jgi:hypothetical protein